MCGDIKPTHSEYIASLNHADQYEYLSEYVNYNAKIHIRCLACDHLFWQRADDHKRGCGCPLCFCKGRYTISYFERNPNDRDIPAILYLVKLYSHNEVFYKVGITTKSVEYRYPKNYTI